MIGTAFAPYTENGNGNVKMLVSQKIDNLVQQLNSLKPMLSADQKANNEHFNIILKDNIVNNIHTENFNLEKPQSVGQEMESNIPSWVDLDYGYDPSNPRKPNMRELIEALSNKNIEELASNDTFDLPSISKLAVEVLYGVVGNKSDTRDWSFIMKAPDILAEARKQTYDMYDPIIDIETKQDHNGQIIEQYAVLKDKTGTRIKTLDGDAEHVKMTLSNFGVKDGNIVEDFEDRLINKYFNQEIVEYLKNFKSGKALAVDTYFTDTNEAVKLKKHSIATETNHTFNVPAEEFAKL